MSYPKTIDEYSDSDLERELRRRRRRRLAGKCDYCGGTDVAKPCRYETRHAKVGLPVPLHFRAHELAARSLEILDDRIAQERKKLDSYRAEYDAIRASGDTSAAVEQAWKSLNSQIYFVEALERLVREVMRAAASEFVTENSQAIEKFVPDSLDGRAEQTGRTMTKLAGTVCTCPCGYSYVETDVRAEMASSVIWLCPECNRTNDTPAPQAIANVDVDG